jgi:hypothetical protein
MNPQWIGGYYMKSLFTKGTAFAAMSLLIAGSALASNQVVNKIVNQEKCEFAPKNDVKVPIGSQKAGQGLDESTYNSAIDIVENYYKPIVAAQGATLTINRMWTNDTANSTAHRSGKKWYVDAYGGLARLAIMTKDAEVAVLCHEMGHHLGGFPQGKGIFGSSWASNEGQADYFATMKCFRRVSENDDNAGIMASAVVPNEVKDGCKNTWRSTKEISLCEREAAAGSVLAQVLYDLGHGTHSKASPRGEPATAPSYSTPDTSVVSATNDAHPMAQCRLDTYFNGAICGVAATEDFGKSEGKTGACAQEKGDTVGYRPTCWYKPGN